MDDSFFRGTRVLVTGATGFIGGHLRSKLSEIGAELHGTSRESRDSSAECRWHRVEDATGLRRVVHDVEPLVVFHLAARTERSRELSLLAPMIEANVMPVAIMGEVLAPRNDARLVVVGSGEGAISPYGVSKLAAASVVSMIHATTGLRAVTARPSVIYGPGQRGTQFLPSLITACKNGERFEMTDGKQQRDFLFVEDLVDGLLHLAAGDRFGGVFDLCSGSSLTILELAQRVRGLIGRGELAVGALPYRSGEEMAPSFDPSPMREAFGWRAKVSLDEGLRRTILAA